MRKRFTLDGTEALEQRLASTCRLVRDRILNLLPHGKLEALLLGGGYGRGEGGVFKTDHEDKPYNDMEFYLFLKGNRWWNEHLFSRALADLAHELSPEAGLHVEFKIQSESEFQRSPISMFSYDLIAGHHTVYGDLDFLDMCRHHLNAEEIPLSEATRLLFNRCTGLLFSQRVLQQDQLSIADQDFLERNLAKSQLAFGDVLLTVSQRYSWSCQERHQRLAALESADDLPWLDSIREHHAAGVKFKLHPNRTERSLIEWRARHAELSDLGMKLWLWLESRRLGQSFRSAWDYAVSPVRKCPENGVLKSQLINLKNFGLIRGWKAGGRYPRENLFNAMALLLWGGDWSKHALESRVQESLHDDKSSCSKLLNAYESLWLRFG